MKMVSKSQFNKILFIKKNVIEKELFISKLFQELEFFLNNEISRELFNEWLDSWMATAKNSLIKRQKIANEKAKINRERIEKEMAEGYKALAKLNRKICDDFKYIDQENW